MALNCWWHLNGEKSAISDKKLLQKLGGEQRERLSVTTETIDGKGRKEDQAMRFLLR